MLAINMDDVINVLNSCKPYLIALGIALAIAIIVTVACMKLKKPVKKLVRKEAWIAFLMAAVVIINLICFIPMSSMISLAMGNGTITEETSNEATALCEDIADEGIVLLKMRTIFCRLLIHRISTYLDGHLQILATVVQDPEHYPMHMRQQHFLVVLRMPDTRSIRN